MTDTIQLLESIDKFNDASFVTFSADGKEVIVRNEANGLLYSFPFYFNETAGTHFLDGTQAKLIGDEIEEPKSILEAGRDFFESEEREIDVILEACACHKKGKPKKEKAKQETGLEEGLLAKETEKAFFQYESIINNIIEEGNLFDEDHKPVQKKEIILPDVIIEMKEWKQSKRDAFLESKDSYEEFNEQVREVLQEAGIQSDVSEVLSGIDPIGGKSFFGLLTKNLAKIKRESSSEFNIESTVMAIDKLREESFTDTFQENYRSTLDAPDMYGHLSNPNTLAYLKFKTGAFGKVETGRLLESFNNVLTKYNELSQEELMSVSKMRDVVDFMYRTEQYDDELLWNIIRQFNMAFSNFKQAPVTNG